MVGVRSCHPGLGHPLDGQIQWWQFAIMVKTQIQFPERLYREAKRISTEYEMSFAEVVRRGLEEAIKAYPPGRTPPDQWELPVGRRMGKSLLPESDWNLAARDEA